MRASLLPRTPLPRTLLWRTFLLVAVLMLLSVAAWFLIFSAYEREPRARQLAQTLASVANLTRASLLAARPDARLGLLRELSDREGIHIYPAEPGETIVPLPNRPLLQLVHQHLREQLGPSTRMTLQRDDERALFVSFSIDEDEHDEFWLALPSERLERIFPMGVLGWGVVVLALSLSGAWLIVFGVTRPLKALERAAQKVGAGETAPQLEEAGPAEMAAVARAFNRMGADLERLDQDRALILAGISHDLRTPLTRLRMGIELSADTELRDGMNADIEEMDRTIAQFLDFARLGAAEGSAERLAVLDPGALLTEVAEQYRRRNLAVALEAVPPAPTFVAVRPQALRRAIANMVDNALRYAPSTLPTLTCRIEGNNVLIEVRDDGPGIPVAEVERLKRPFTRLDAARSNTVGAGLGLAIVDRVARSHGGKLHLLPAPGGGLLARLELPLQEAPP